MKKIGQFIEEIDTIRGVKTAFVSADAVNGGQGGQQQQGGDPNALMQQVMQQLQSLPPEIQQQAQQQLQQVQSMPPEQQVQALQQISQGINQIMSQQGGQQPQGAQAQGQPPQQGGQQQAGTPMESTEGHVQAENQLDNTKITISVRELLDLVSGGSASAAMLKVKQLADSHNQKVQANQQKMQQDQAKAQAEQQAQAQMAQSGGLYPAAPDASGKSSGGQAQPQQPGM